MASNSLADPSGATKGTPTNTPPFQHIALDSSKQSFRLLEVCSLGAGGLVECILHNESLADHVPYVALSYTWEQDGGFEHIRCNGQLMRVGRNLWDFLFRYSFRRHADRNLIWVDAICINQEDVDERNHQVSQMRDIYSGASSVVVWLGENMNNTEGAFMALKLSENIAPEDGHDIREHISPKQWISLINLLQRPYWQRVWIVQEFILAQSLEIWLGGHVTDVRVLERFQHWDLLENAFPEYAALSKLLSSPGWTLLTYRASWWHKRPVFTLRQLLGAFKKSYSSDPRDRVYGLLGLVPETSDESDAVQVDYNKSMVEIVVDVIISQYAWIPNSNNVNLQTVNFVVDCLGVSHVEVALYVLDYEPRLWTQLCVVAAGEYTVTSLRYLGTVESVKKRPFSVSHDRSPSFTATILLWLCIVSMYGELFSWAWLCYLFAAICILGFPNREQDLEENFLRSWKQNKTKLPHGAFVRVQQSTSSPRATISREDVTLESLSCRRNKVHSSAAYEYLDPRKRPTTTRTLFNPRSWEEAPVQILSILSRLLVWDQSRVEIASTNRPTAPVKIDAWFSGAQVTPVFAKSLGLCPSRPHLNLVQLAKSSV